MNPVPNQQALPGAPASLPLNPPPSRILVVDDDRLNGRILRGILQPAGHQVTEVGSGEAALDACAELRPDLVLLDVMLPGLNGFATCREMKKRFGAQCPPVIFITAKSDSSDVLEGFEAGGVDYLPKPFRNKEALARIRTHLQNRLLVDQLSRANAAKNRLLGMAAHDLRNPLASIRGLAEFLRNGTVGPLLPDQQDLVNTIHEASQSMLELVNDLLDTSVIESGELKINLEVCSLDALVEKSVRLNSINAAQKNTRIVLRPGSPSRSARVDGQKMKQVLDNLLGNATKFSPAGSIITVQTDETDSQYFISVQDQGPGIPENEQHRLFQDFGVTSVRPTGGEKSTGLGLAICRRIIEAHRGRIEASNRPGGGCEFKISIPLET
ncbi:MAG TPA: response regulator [Candidatus Didemnitutus sp.]|jgi:signal transduction histidine kinase